MQLQTSMQSMISVNIFGIGLLRLPTRAYDATASTAAVVVSRLQRV